MKRILIYLITLLILSAFQSCADETVLETDSGGRDILIHLNMGGGKSSTRAMSTAQEDYVDETSLAILAFEKEGTGYTYAYRPQIKSADIANNTMRVVCKPSQKEPLFLIVANTAEEV